MRKPRDYQTLYALYWKAVLHDHLDWAAQLHALAHLAAREKAAGEAMYAREVAWTEYDARTGTMHTIRQFEDGSCDVHLFTLPHGDVIAVLD